MNLVIDLGNTQAKYGIYHHNQLIEQWIENNSKRSSKKHGQNLDITQVIISSVIKFRPRNLPQEKKSNTILLTHNTPLPIKNKYATPETLGNDRLANAVGATIVFPGKDVLIIDTGTCIKYDFIDKRKNYFGGAISPGLEMRFKALNSFTSKLPLVEPSKKFQLTGRDTKQSILSGVQNGIIFEIKGTIKEYRKKYKNLKVILTGGDHSFFANHLKNSIFAAPNLTLQGLNEILNYNVSKNS